jgi:shikimate kinase
MHDTDANCERFITPRILNCRRRFNSCGTRIYESRRRNGQPMIPLIGPGGAGKSTIGALVAEPLGVPFVDLDRHFAGRVGDISEYIGRHGYDAYARENVEAYCSLFREGTRPEVVALSSGFMTYASDIHPEYGRMRREIEQWAQTFVLLPSLDRELCVAETVRRQVARPFGRSPEREEAVIRTRFEIYMALPIRKVETMRPPAAIVNEILAALSPANDGPLARLEPSALRTPKP